MEYRGSKSIIIFITHCLKIIIVKEQRVDGSYHSDVNNHVIKVYSNGSRKRLSNQNPFLINNFYICNHQMFTGVSNRKFSTISPPKSLDSNFVL
jgi:hypothetical protein